MIVRRNSGLHYARLVRRERRARLVRAFVQAAFWTAAAAALVVKLQGGLTMGDILKWAAALFVAGVFLVLWACLAVSGALARQEEEDAWRLEAMR